MTYDQAKLEIEAQYKRFKIAIENIAAAAQRDIVNPFCDRNQVKFVTGMGAYTFFQGEKNVGTDWESTLSVRGRPPWKRAPADYPYTYKTLNIEVDSTSHLFQYMEDYDGQKR